MMGTQTMLIHKARWIYPGDVPGFRAASCTGKSMQDEYLARIWKNVTCSSCLKKYVGILNKNGITGAQEMTRTEAVYEQYKHLDYLLSDKQWLRPNGELGMFPYQILYDLWQAVRVEQAGRLNDSTKTSEKT